MLNLDTFQNGYLAMARYFGCEVQPETPQIFFEYLASCTSDESFEFACKAAISELGHMPTALWLKERAAGWSQQQRDVQAPQEIKAAIAGVTPAALPGTGTAEDPRQMDAIGPDHPAWIVPRDQIQSITRSGEFGFTVTDWKFPFPINGPLAIRRQWANLLHHGLCTPGQAKMAATILKAVTKPQPQGDRPAIRPVPTPATHWRAS